jgi:hypothetical protein
MQVELTSTQSISYGVHFTKGLRISSPFDDKILESFGYGGNDQ